MSICHPNPPKSQTQQRKQPKKIKNQNKATNTNSTVNPYFGLGGQYLFASIPNQNIPIHGFHSIPHPEKRAKFLRKWPEIFFGPIRSVFFGSLVYTQVYATGQYKRHFCFYPTALPSYLHHEVWAKPRQHLESSSHKRWKHHPGNGW